ncbi:MAG: GspE/PulE family protein [Kiritimatiellia bacterium]|jgi:type IV pilus assembly protein PilB|nr:GspE/PulE family protein [Kiritimatiellia bacterium]
MAESDHIDPVLQLVSERTTLTEELASDIMEEEGSTGKPVRQILIDMGLLTEEQMLELFAEYLGTEVINLPATDVPPDVVHSVPASVARMYNVVPVEVGPNSVKLATSSLVSPEVMDELMFVLTRDVSFVMAREDDCQTFINQFYGDDSAAVTDMLSALESEIEDSDALLLGDEEDEHGIEEAAGSTPVIRFVNLVLYQAVNDRASDIHFEPFEKEFKIRYRVDGALYEMRPPAKRLAMPIISRVKVMSNLNIAERRLPQDGRIQLTIAGRQIDLRVSTLPTQFGESVVLRVLDRSVVSLDLENLGLPTDMYDTIIQDIERPNGIVIVTGPTGSGKTTTLYSCLRRINKIENKLLTAEEPVEYDIEGIIQVPISEAADNTFHNVLRAFLRQDPDVMMVGEIRDLDTAQISVQAALTGHMVFSTLHTNDAAGAVTRLIDMDVEPYLISSTLTAVLGQRLVRTICTHCKTAYEPDDDLIEQLSLTREDVAGRSFYYGTGCQHCNDTGYHGRKGIYEYLRVTDKVRELIDERKPTLIIREEAIREGMRPLREDGVRSILDGYTTAEEVLKYT